MCESAGTAIVLRPEALTRANLTAAVRSVVNDERYVDGGAAECAEEIAAMPDAVSVSKSVRSWRSPV